MGRVHDTDFKIRVPLKMIQFTDKKGKAFPLAFYWTDEDGAEIEVKVERVNDILPYAEQRSGTVGDRYECIIDGQIEYLYYSLIAPRKWFKLLEVSEAEYKAYYRLPGEGA